MILIEKIVVTIIIKFNLDDIYYHLNIKIII